MGHSTTLKGTPLFAHLAKRQWEWIAGSEINPLDCEVGKPLHYRLGKALRHAPSWRPENVSFSRGRDDRCQTPPAQIRTGAL